MEKSLASTTLTLAIRTRKGSEQIRSRLTTGAWLMLRPFSLCQPPRNKISETRGEPPNMAGLPEICGATGTLMMARWGI